MKNKFTILCQRILCKYPSFNNNKRTLKYSFETTNNTIIRNSYVTHAISANEIWLTKDSHDSFMNKELKIFSKNIPSTASNKTSSCCDPVIILISIFQSADFGSGGNMKLLKFLKVDL